MLNSLHFSVKYWWRFMFVQLLIRKWTVNKFINFICCCVNIRAYYMIVFLGQFTILWYVHDLPVLVSLMPAIRYCSFDSFVTGLIKPSSRNN